MEGNKSVAPTDTLDFKAHEQAGWTFHHSSYPMSDSKELERLTDQAGTELPEVFYGRNHLYVANEDRNFLLDICPVDAISLSGFENRKQAFSESSDPVTCVPTGDESTLNKVEADPKPIEVQQAAVWKKKDTSTIKDF